MILYFLMRLFDNDSKGWFHSACAHPFSIDDHSGKIHVFAGISCAWKVFMHTPSESI